MIDPTEADRALDALTMDYRRSGHVGTLPLAIAERVAQRAAAELKSARNGEVAAMRRRNQAMQQPWRALGRGQHPVIAFEQANTERRRALRVLQDAELRQRVAERCLRQSRSAAERNNEGAER